MASKVPVEEEPLTGIKTRGTELLRVVSYRCPTGGYLKTFAPRVQDTLPPAPRVHGYREAAV